MNQLIGLSLDFVRCHCSFSRGWCPRPQSFEKPCADRAFLWKKTFSDEGTKNWSTRRDGLSYSWIL